MARLWDAIRESSSRDGAVIADPTADKRAVPFPAIDVPAMFPNLESRHPLPEIAGL
jgi:hypothetical protein